MSRCKACNAVVDNPLSKPLPNKLPEDMCRTCISLAYDTTPEKEYQHGLLTEDPLNQLLDNNEIDFIQDY